MSYYHSTCFLPLEMDFSQEQLGRSSAHAGGLVNTVELYVEMNDSVQDVEHGMGFELVYHLSPLLWKVLRAPLHYQVD